MKYHFEISGDVETTDHESAWEAARDALTNPHQLESLSISIAQVPDRKPTGFAWTDKNG
jgi:hypothetical protein